MEAVMTSSLYVNDYSFHGQFVSHDEVIDAIQRLWTLRTMCQEYSAQCFCSRSILGNREVVDNMTLREVVVRYPHADIRRLILSWLDKHGPFWDTDRQHDAGDWYFTFHGAQEILTTDSALAECTRQVLAQECAALLSATPSDFTYTPVQAGVRDDEVVSECELPNHWGCPPLKQYLDNTISLCSWLELRDHAAQRFANLVFTNNAFTPIMNSPFSFALRDRIIRLLDILNQLSGEMDIQTGALSPNGEALRKTFFEGKNALFTDSSDTEKAAFKTALSFRCPISEDLQLFPWHGKTRANGQYRVHFGWPKPAPSDGLPVVYIGPKITKQ
ncbi:MAG: hypothetical protein F4234_13715 [Gammaproteobacteria bacterium]|nr:hypothetical protein [Gammaproteobacteria bacterium]MXZ31900.1 hypothetical protein [Gammaproteobacteria bacterium]MYE29169.1 hypothetical protein [Gammaproteobacteria bacterium]MYF01197.1 hypothetical protein [Gammaproteobacteria bacterium]